jgi:hypothetical protein
MLLVTGAVTGLAARSPAAPITWIGGNTTWSDNAGAANFLPADEPDPDDEAIFNTPNSVSLATDNSIMALTMSGGIDLATDGHNLTVNGLAQLVNASTNLVIEQATSQVSADSVTINSGGQVRLAGGTLRVIEETGNGTLDINASGTLSGNGTVNMADAVPGVTTLIINDGTISASTFTLIIVGGPPAGTLALNAADPTDARIDLDGTSGNGVVNVFRNQTLDNNLTLSDDFSGDANLFHNSTLDMAAAWTLDTGTIDVDNGFVPGSVIPFIPAIPADVSFIAGGAFTQSGGTITIVDSDGTLQFNAPFTQSGGTLTNNGLAVFNANATIGAGANFTMPSTSSSLTVNAGVTVNVDQPNFNADGSGAVGNIITVNSGGVLDLDLGAAGDAELDNIINLNGGELDVTAPAGAWTIENTVNMAFTAGNGAALDGNPLSVGNDAGTLDANLNVSGAGVSQINTPVTFLSDADVNIAAGATLEITGSATFSSVGAASNADFTGSGILELEGNANVIAEDTVINMPNGRVDLDGGGGLVLNTAQTLTLSGLDADLTLNVAGIDTADNSFGKTNFPVAPDTIVLNSFADLTVNLTDPNAEWTLNANALLDINAVGGGFAGSGIQGSDFNMAGTAEISGNSIWTARTDISGTATIAALGSLNLRGGDLVDVNRLENGTINGAGSLHSLNNTALFGFGTIDAAVDFSNNTELRADDGVLTINGALVDAGVLGTADVDGILNIPAAWNTGGPINTVDMLGGEIRGGTITNDNTGGINGFGLVSARVINNTRLEGEHAGTLIVETAANNNDWDGAAGDGDLRANGGNLEVRDNAAFAFTGLVLADAGREVFVNGFELEFQPAAALTLQNGTFRSTNSTRFGGALTAQAGGDSTIDVAGTFIFETGSASTLNDDVRLANDATVVETGATFTGGGSLINLPGSTLRLLDGVTSGDLAVLVENQGVLQLDTGGTAGQVQGVDYEQVAGGLWNVDLGGTGLNDFDRLNLTGAASIAGTLDIDLFGGYVPALGDTLNILSATGGVLGTFTTVNEPGGLPAGLLFDVVYTPTLVQLVVVNGPIYSADFDGDGDVDADDLTVWNTSEGVDDGADADGDGDSDGADFLAWQLQLGSVPATPTAGGVPEPQGALLLVTASAALHAAGKRRRTARRPG